MRGLFLGTLLFFAQTQSISAEAPPFTAAADYAVAPDQVEAAEAEVDRLIHDGQYDAADALAAAVLTTRISQTGPDSPELLIAMFARGEIANHQDRVADWLDWRRQAYEIADAALPVHDMRRHVAAMGYALALSGNGRAAEALPLAVTATQYAVILLGPTSPATLTWKYNIAGLYVDLKQYELALPVFDELLAAFAADPDPERRDNEAVMTRQRARLMNKLLRDEEAVDGFALALGRYEVAFGPDHPETARTAMEYAQALLFARRFDALAQVLPDTSRRITVAYGAESFQAATMLYLQAYVVTDAAGSGTANDPVELINQAVAMAERAVGPASDHMKQMYLDQAGILDEARDYTGALAAARKARGLHALDRDSYFWTLFQARDAGAITADAAASEAFEVAQLATKSRASSAILELNKRLIAEEGAFGEDWRKLTDLVRQETELQSEMAVLNDQPLGRRDAATEARVRNHLIEVSGEIIELQGELGQKDPAKAGLLGEGYMPVSEIQSTLEPDEALVFVDAISNFQSHFVFVVTSDAVDWVYTPLTTEEMTANVVSIRDGIGLKLGTRSALALDGDAAAKIDFDFAASSRLYDQTFGLVSSQISDKAHLYVVLNGPMSGLPPGLLLQQPNPEGDLTKANWLIRDHALTVLPSVASLRTATLARKTARADLSFLGFGNPEFDSDQSSTQLAAAETSQTSALRGSLISLPETALEVRQVAEALGASSDAVRFGLDASESAFKRAALSDYRVIYFATHGLVSGDIVGTAALDQPALALTAGAGEDGFLTESEVVELKLNADWVVLSACNTAVGDKPGAEALSGLAQAFFYAGARALLVSHWPVESRSAVALMTKLFDLRSANPQLRAAEAQQRAMLDMIDSPADARWSHPAYWALFILVGSPD